MLAGGSLKMQFFISILVFVEENYIDSTGNRKSVNAHITPIRSLPEGTHGGKILGNKVGNTAFSGGISTPFTSIGYSRAFCEMIGVSQMEVVLEPFLLN